MFFENTNKKKKFTLETKLQWIKSTWSKLKFSNIPLDDLAFKKIIITNIPTPTKPNVYKNTIVKSIKELDDFLALDSGR